jgi:hypothetical protein
MLQIGMQQGLPAEMPPDLAMILNDLQLGLPPGPPVGLPAGVIPMMEVVIHTPMGIIGILMPMNLNRQEPEIEDNQQNANDDEHKNEDNEVD